ncbi:MAG: YccF domain-containing protein [Solirubrobacteraceae bacterium]
MRIILNILWLLLSGIWLFIAYLFAAVLCFIFIITIPFGIAALRIAVYALWPFGRTVVKKETAGAGSVVVNVLWFLIGGWYLTLVHIVSGVALCLTIVGIPLGLGNFKMIRVSLMPFGHQIVSVAEARSIAAEHQVAIGA